MTDGRRFVEFHGKLGVVERAGRMVFVFVVTAKLRSVQADVFRVATCGARMELMLFVRCGGETIVVWSGDVRSVTAKMKTKGSPWF